MDFRIELSKVKNGLITLVITGFVFAILVILWNVISKYAIPVLIVSGAIIFLLIITGVIKFSNFKQRVLKPIRH